MEQLFGSLGLLSILFYLVLILLWVLVPFFIILISRRVKEMRDIARESQMEVKELSANIQYLTRKFNENSQQE